MVVVTTRAATGTELTWPQVDGNFVALAEAVNTVGEEVIGEATAAKDLAVAAAAAAQLSAGSAASAANSSASSANIASGIAASLAAPDASDILGYLLAAGLVQRSVGDALRDRISLFDFIPKAQKAAIQNRTSSYDCTADINRAISFCNAIGGATLDSGRGKFRCDGMVVMKPYVEITGVGKIGTEWNFTGTGDGIRTNSPINTSTGVYTKLSNMLIRNQNSGNTGGGVVDVCGTFVQMDNVIILGFWANLILDQTEIASFSRGNLEQPINRSIWIVNGPEHTVGAQTGFTNRITFNGMQLNGAAPAIAIVDDGGYSHHFIDCNFNGYKNHLRTAGGTCVMITGGEWEASSEELIVCASTRFDSGAGTGGTLNLDIRNAVLVPRTDQSVISITSLGSFVSTNNFYGNSTAPKIKGLSACSSFISIGDVNGGGGALTSGVATYMSVNGEVLSAPAPSNSFTPTLTINGSSAGITYSSQTGRYARVGNAIQFSLVVALSNKGANTGAVAIGGLPGTSFAAMGQAMPPPFATGVSSVTTVGALIGASSNSVSLQNANVNYTSSLLESNISNTTSFSLSGSYLVA